MCNVAILWIISMSSMFMLYRQLVIIKANLAFSVIIQTIFAIAWYLVPIVSTIHVSSGATAEVHNISIKQFCFYKHSY